MRHRCNGGAEQAITKHKPQGGTAHTAHVAILLCCPNLSSEMFKLIVSSKNPTTPHEKWCAADKWYRPSCTARRDKWELCRHNVSNHICFISGDMFELYRALADVIKCVFVWVWVHLSVTTQITGSDSAATTSVTVLDTYCVLSQGVSSSVFVCLVWVHYSVQCSKLGNYGVTSDIERQQNTISSTKKNKGRTKNGTETVITWHISLTRTTEPVELRRQPLLNLKHVKEQ